MVSLTPVNLYNAFRSTLRHERAQAFRYLGSVHLSESREERVEKGDKHT